MTFPRILFGSLKGLASRIFFVGGGLATLLLVFRRKSCSGIPLDIYNVYWEIH